MKPASSRCQQARVHWVPVEPLRTPRYAPQSPGFHEKLQPNPGRNSELVSNTWSKMSNCHIVLSDEIETCRTKIASYAEQAQLAVDSCRLSKSVPYPTCCGYTETPTHTPSSPTVSWLLYLLLLAQSGNAASLSEALKWCRGTGLNSDFSVWIRSYPNDKPILLMFLKSLSRSGDYPHRLGGEIEAGCETAWIGRHLQFELKHEVWTSIGKDFVIEHRTPESTTRRVRLEIDIPTQIPSFKKPKRGHPMGIPKRCARTFDMFGWLKVIQEKCAVTGWSSGF